MTVASYNSDPWIAEQRAIPCGDANRKSPTLDLATNRASNRFSELSRLPVYRRITMASAIRQKFRIPETIGLIEIQHCAALCIDKEQDQLELD